MGGSGSESSESSERQFRVACYAEVMRVVTLNIWNKSGPWKQRMQLIGAELDRLDADVIGLQEVLELRAGSHVDNQCEEFKGSRGYVYGAAHTVMESEGGGLFFGNAVMSKHPIREHTVLPLPGDDPSDAKRALLHAVVEMPFGPVDVFVTHLSWKLHDGVLRQAQIKEVVRLIMERAPIDGRYPPLLLGDLNAEPQSDEVRYLGGYTSLGEPQAVRFQDAWHYVDAQGAEGRGATFDGNRNPFAGLVHEPPRRIDYLFTRGPDARGRGKPSYVSVCFDQPADGVFASDHFGVVADYAE